MDRNETVTFITAIIAVTFLLFSMISCCKENEKRLAETRKQENFQTYERLKQEFKQKLELTK